MGVLKGRFQCLRGLRVKINSHKDHCEAMRWISVSIILHNLIIDINGTEDFHREWEDGSGGGNGTQGDDDMQGDHGPSEDEDEDEDDPAVSKRNQLIAELLLARDDHDQLDLHNEYD